MHSHVDYCWHKTFLNRTIKTLICFCLVYTPFFANAGAAEKWELVENFYDSSKNTVNVTAKKVSQQAANSGVYKVQVPVSASTLGSTVKMMLKGGVASAALYGLVEGVGWIIDEGSKTIKKPVEPDKPNYPYIYKITYGASVAYFPTISGLCLDAFNRGGWAGDGKPITVLPDGYSCQFMGGLGAETGAVNAYAPGGTLGEVGLRIVNPDYNQDLETEYVAVGDSELGNEILGNGTEPNSSLSPSPSIITDAYSPNNPVSDAPAPQKTNQALENANPQPEKEPEGSSETEKEKDPETGAETGKETSKFELPNFCEWAPAVCAFFTVQKQDNKDLKENQKEDIAQNKTFFDSVKDFFDWTKENPDIPDDNQPPQITPIDIGQLDTGTFKATAGCPAPIQVPVSFGKGGNVEISYEPICSFASKWSFVAPLIGFLSGAMIIVGVGRKGEDGEI